MPRLVRLAIYIAKAMLQTIQHRVYNDCNDIVNYGLYLICRTYLPGSIEVKRMIVTHELIPRNNIIINKKALQ